MGLYQNWDSLSAGERVLQGLQITGKVAEIALTVMPAGKVVMAAKTGWPLALNVIEGLKNTLDVGEGIMKEAESMRGILTKLTTDDPPCNPASAPKATDIAEAIGEAYDDLADSLPDSFRPGAPDPANPNESTPSDMQKAMEGTQQAMDLLSKLPTDINDDFFTELRRIVNQLPDIRVPDKAQFNVPMPDFTRIPDLWGELATLYTRAPISTPGASQTQPVVNDLGYYWMADVAGLTMRGFTPDGNVEIFAPPQTLVELQMFAPKANTIGTTYFVTTTSGSNSSFGRVAMHSTAGMPDADGDQLVDDAEFIVGTMKTDRDTDSDGVADYAELLAGTNPLDNRPAATGVVSSARLSGPAMAVEVIAGASANPGLNAFVATGSHGLAILDVSRISTPTVLSELNLAGSNVDVAVDATRGLAIVAGTEAGLHIVDITNPRAPTLLQTVTLSDLAQRVELRDGTAYVASGDSIVSLDINTGEIRLTLDFGHLGGSTLIDIAVDGDTLYSIDGNRNLRAISLADENMVLLDTLTLARGNGRLFVGGGVAYVGGNGGFQQGYSTVDVSMPTDLRLLSDPDATNIVNTVVVANGSGLGIAVGALQGLGNSVHVLNLSDPTRTDVFITQLPLPAVPYDVALANGLAFIADGSSGLQIVNYIAFDNQGIAPIVSISVDGVDADPATPGIQVLEGRSLQITPTISDDVQVRNVELLVNGAVVSNDVSFPFEMFAQAPTIAVGGTTLALQVRATDTGGNSSLSNLVSLTVVPDTFAPVLVSANVADGDRRFFLKSIDLRFDEPLDTTRLNTSGVSLLRAGADGLFGTADDMNESVRLDTRARGQALSILPNGNLLPGDYRLTVDNAMISDLTGNLPAADITRQFTIRPASDVRASSGIAEISTAPSANPGQQIGISVPFDPTTAKAQIPVIDAGGTRSTTIVLVTRWDSARGIAYFNVPLNAVTGDMVVYSLVGNVRTDFTDGAFPLQVVPTVTGLDISSVASDGSVAYVYLYGSGFIEGNNSEYRLGTGATGVVVLDAGTNTGPDAQNRTGVVNGQAYLTVPLSNGVFGPITVKTAGGVSVPYSVNLAGITATAMSGTPADAGQASANPGQAIMLTGTGLTTSTDVLLRYTNGSGNLEMVKLNPSAAAADGTSATLVIPNYANGAATLQVFGSASQPLLQIVPLLSSYDVSSSYLYLYGAGLAEGARYDFTGFTATDIDANIDVTSNNQDNGRAILYSAALPRSGLGNLTVTTAGGTSAPLDLNFLRPGSDSAPTGSLGDVAIDPATGALWVLDEVNPGHLLRLDPTSGQVLQTLILTAAYGSTSTGSYAGLQVLSSAMSLAGTLVPAGSLLLFNGNVNPDRVVAINATTGAVIASLTLAGNYNLTAGVYDAASGNLFVTDLRATNTQIIEINPATGAEVGSSTKTGTWSDAGIAIDPVSGNLWLGTRNNNIWEVTRSGTTVRTVDLSLQGVNNTEISGLAFDTNGKLLVASTNGVVYQVDLAYDPAIKNATLSQIVAAANNGTATNAVAASTNVGQVIELIGTNFGAGTQVVFPGKDNDGKEWIYIQPPLAINPGGTRLQVMVPDLARTADIWVVNQGATNLGFSSSNDAIYRNITLDFTANGDSAVVRFADGGLESLSDESWGLDNIVVKQGDTIVFQDDFEGGTNAAWSTLATNRDARGVFSEFSGRFNNAGQTLNLSGLTASQSYSLSFDLYILDDWDGTNISSGPDKIAVSVDGTPLFNKAFANQTNLATFYGASAGQRLQVVPTLTGPSSGWPGTDSTFSLNGSGFMEGATTVTVGGVVLADTSTIGSPFDVTGSRNDSLSVVAPLTLDGPIRISTEGGWAEVSSLNFGAQTTVAFTGISASATTGLAADLTKASANTGQSIILAGQGFTSSTLVQFQGIDDSGALGTITRTGTAGNNGTTLTLQVPALARSGAVTVLGSNTSFNLQVVPNLRSVGGTIAVGNILVLEGSGLTSNDLAIQIDGRGVGSFSVKTVYDGASGSSSQQLLTLTVPAGISNGVITVSTAGGSATLRKGISIATLATLTPAAEVGDTLATAQTLGLDANQRINVSSVIGGALGGLDVDLYRLDLNAYDFLTLNMNGSAFSSRLRLFDSTGKELAAQYFGASGNSPWRFTVPATGTYYLGVSGYSNTGYIPNTAGSGNSASHSGQYQLAVERLGARSSSLTGITATAASGTPTHAGIASANTGQTLTLTGSGLVSGDQVVFSSLDTSGNLAEVTVNPASVAADGLSLTVVVPATAATGHVRLARENAGLLVQIVPTLTDLGMSVNGSFIGGGLTLTGSGFAEGASAVLFGAQRVNDSSRGSGLDVISTTSLYFTVPDAMPSGPIRVVTVGGTSAAFGLSLTGISATAAGGNADNAAQSSANPGQAITLNGAGFHVSMEVVFQTSDAGGSLGEVIVRPSTVNAEGTQAQVVVPLNAVSGALRLLGDSNASAIPLQIIPTLTGVEISSVASDGSVAYVYLYGSGFVEGNNSEYRLGTGATGVVLLDSSTSSGPDAQNRSGVLNGQAYLTVPLSDGVFGPITVKTAGGVSAPYSVNLAGISTTALSGTPADAGQASANPGQAITLTGTGLSTDTDVLLRYTNSSSVVQMVKLNPSAAAADGSSATLAIPAYANGAATLQVFGAASQPLLQIVPLLSSYDVTSGYLDLYGAGLMEGARYDFTGFTATDIDGNINVASHSQDNGRAILYNAAIPRSGLGNLTVTTTGGTSAPLALNFLRPGSDTAATGNLGDVAIDPASGALWVLDTANPGHLLRLDPASGAVLQSLTVTTAYGSTSTGAYVGLQVLGSAMSLAGTPVPAGSLLLFNGNVNPDRVVAINATTGAVIASLALGANHNLTAGVYDAVSGNLFLLPYNASVLNEIDPATGALIDSVTLPIGSYTYAGLAIDPATGHFWIGSTQGNVVVLVDKATGAEIRRVDLALQGVDNSEISGLAFAPDGSLRVASTQSVVYKVVVG